MTAGFHISKNVPGAVLVLLFSFFVLDSVAQQPEREAVSAGIEWETELIREGIIWKKYQGDDLFDAKLSINIVEVDQTTAYAGFKIAYVQNELVKTSDLADRADAIAAVNGSFFSSDAGESVVFMKVGGAVITDGAVNGNPYTENGGIGWNEREPVQIYSKPEMGWHSLDTQNLLSSGPLLIKNGQILNFNNDPFNQNRHPRTAVATTTDGKLLMITVDGRSFQSFGMTIPELAQFLADLGVKDALNLDGGGSTSMWIRNQKTDGIVNYPSDNFEFDHEGERSVSNALILIDNNN